MSKYLLVILFSLLFYSCYTYKTYEPEDELKENNNSIENTKLTSIRGNRNPNNPNSIITAPKVDLENISVKTIIKEKEYYQLEVFKKDYKIEAVKWEGDTLIAHQKGKPSKEYKFNEKDIQNLKVRKFSKSRSDALTVTAYVMGGVAIFLLVK